jgi:hypothetical protein
MRVFPSPILSAPMQHGVTENLKSSSLLFFLFVVLSHCRLLLQNLPGVNKWNYKTRSRDSRPTRQDSAERLQSSVAGIK